MRKVLIIVCLCLFLIGCTNDDGDLILNYEKCNKESVYCHFINTRNNDVSANITMDCFNMTGCSTNFTVNL